MNNDYKWETIGRCKFYTDGTTCTDIEVMDDAKEISFIINFKPGNPIPLGAGRKGSFFYKKIKKISYFFYSLLKNPAY